MTVGPPFYKQVNGPLLLVLLILMGVGPLLAWRQTELRDTATRVAALLGTGRVVAIVAILGSSGQPLAAIGFAAAVFAIAAVGVEYWRGARLRRKNAGDALPAAVYRLTRRDPAATAATSCISAWRSSPLASSARSSSSRSGWSRSTQGESATVAGYTMATSNCSKTRRRCQRVTATWL